MKKTSFQVGMDQRKGQKQGRDEKIQQHYRTTELLQLPFWPPMQCTYIPSSLRTQHSGLGMQVHCGGGRKGGCHHSVVG